MRDNLIERFPNQVVHPSPLRGLVHHGRWAEAMNDKHKIIVQAVKWAYDQALSGVGKAGIESVDELAEGYLSQSGSLESKVDSLIRWQVAKASSAGFVTGLGGFTTMPVTLPANLTSVIFIQLRMIAAIARMGGLNPHDDRVRTLAFACLAGNSTITEAMKQAGVLIGRKLTQAAIERISAEILKKINQAIGFRLVTKFGQTGAVNLGKAIPIVGGIVSGSFDGVSTRVVGKVAKKAFIQI